MMTQIRTIHFAIMVFVFCLSGIPANAQHASLALTDQPSIPHVENVRTGVGMTQDLARRVGYFQGGESEENSQEGENEPGEAEEGEAEEFETDRDSFTPATTTVRQGHALVETAYSFIDNRNVKETHSVPELIVRYGWRENVELRVGWNYEVGGAGNPISGNVPGFESEVPGLEKESRILYGTKLFLTRQNGWIPTSSFITQGSTPTAGESNFTALNATHVFGWKLGERVSWNNAMRYATSQFEEDHFNVWEPSTVLKLRLTERVNSHVEYFGVMSDGRDVETTQHFISTGASFLATPNLELGARSGWGLNDQSPNYFINVGAGILF